MKKEPQNFKSSEALFYILNDLFIKENHAYSVLHLSQAYPLAPGTSLAIPFLLILCLDTDLHFGQDFISRGIFVLSPQCTKY